MNETEFKLELKQKLEDKLGNDYCVKKDENLIYKVIIDKNLHYEPNNPGNPKRGDYAFQTDLLIEKRESNLPLVVIETKYGGFSTHDVLTYSTKALKHKEIYPYIRYGLVVGGKDKIDNKFFTHNVGFDFAFALKEIYDTDLQILKTIILEQLKSAERLLDIFTNKKRVDGFSSTIKLKPNLKKQE